MTTENEWLQLRQENHQLREVIAQQRETMALQHEHLLFQKVSGSFRRVRGAQTFCRIRSYLSTLRKQGSPLLAALEATLKANPFFLLSSHPE